MRRSRSLAPFGVAAFAVVTAVCAAAAPTASASPPAAQSLPCSRTDRSPTRSSFRECRSAAARATVSTDVTEFLATHAEALALPADLAGLDVASHAYGLSSATTRFRQTLAGYPIMGAEISVTQDLHGSVRAIHSAYRAGAAPAGVVAPRLGSMDAVAAAMAAIYPLWLRLPSTTRLLWYGPASELSLCWEVVIFSADPLGDFALLVDADTGRVLHKENRMAYAEGSALVYLPNPVQSSANPLLIDANDTTNTLLDAQRVAVDLRRLDEQSGLLRGSYVDVASVSGGLPVDNADEAGRTYAYTRDDPRFEQAMVYYTIDSIQLYIHELGFSNDGSLPNGIRDFPSLADAHWSESDQSFYSIGDDTVHYGDGGVDDAEDADIIAHEYGHALQFAQNPCWGGGEMNAMGEGFGDYLAAAFHESAGNSTYQAAHAACVGEWDATAYGNTIPACLRRVDGDKIYPDDLSGLPHADGEIWSRALWDLRARLGGERTDRLILEHHFSLPCEASMADAALEILQANVMLNAGLDDDLMREAFCDRGILTASDCVSPDPLELTVNVSPPSPRAGSTATYTLTATNNLPVALSDVALRDILSPETAYVSESASDGASEQGRMLSWPLFDLAAGSSVQRSFRVAVSPEAGSPTLFLDDVEHGRSAWTVAHDQGDLDWWRSEARPASGEHHWRSADPELVSEQNLELSVPVRLPAGAALWFAHAYDTERGFDGGVIEITTDGVEWVDLGAELSEHGYDGALSSLHGNPLGGRAAFTGTSGGYVSTRADLSAYAGSNVRIRFRFGSDTSVSADGWDVDDIRFIVESHIGNLTTATSSLGHANVAITQTLVAPLEPECGDGFIQPPHEQCDIGHTDGGLCCSSDCRFEQPGLPCGDDDICNGVSACDDAGRCSTTPPLSCDDGNPCSDDTCDARSGCRHTPSLASCDDGDACNGHEICDESGTCASAASLDCDDDNPCTDDGCDAQSGCNHTAHRRSCSDGDSCNGEERCDGAGACVAGEALDCDDSNVCTDDRCDPASGCVHTMNSQPCGGGVCHRPGQCVAGLCSGTPLLDCNDDNSCTDDACDETMGCSHRANTAPCRDGNACNGLEVCDSGICRAGPPLDCNDLNPCTRDSCHPALGCISMPEKGDCDDANVCNGKERCVDGTCVAGTALDCDDDNPCSNDDCDANDGCLHSARDGACEAGDVCTVGTCVDGGCVAGDPRAPSEAELTATTKLGGDNDRLLVELRFDSEFGTVVPTETGLTLFVVDPTMTPVYLADIPASRFVDVGGRGRRFRYQGPADAAEGDDGLRLVRIRVADPPAVAVQLRAKMRGSEIPLAPGLSSMTVGVLFGDDATGPCVTAVALPCSTSGSHTRCATE